MDSQVPPKTDQPENRGEGKDTQAGRGVRWGRIAIAVVILAPIMWLFLMPQGGTPIEFINELRCRDQLRQIGSACYVYAAEYDGMLPFSEDGSLASLSLLYDQCLENAIVFACPESQDDASGLTPGQTMKGSMCSYLYLPGLLGMSLRDDVPADLIVAYDKEMFHKREKMANSSGGRIVLFADAHAERMSEADFQAQLKKDKARYIEYHNKPKAKASGDSTK